MKNYYKVMPGSKSINADECINGNFIGADYGIHIDLTNQLPEDWGDINHQYIPIYLADNPGKSKIAAGLACGGLWTICKGIKKGDIIVSPNGKRVVKSPVIIPAIQAVFFLIEDRRNGIQLLFQELK